MKNEEIQQFTMRITQSNHTELIVVIFDIFLKYIEDAMKAFENGDMNSYRVNLSKSQPVVSQLIEGLEFKYEISAELYKVYKYALRRISKAIIKKDPKYLEQTVTAMTMIRDEFFEISKNDDSEPLMKNYQKVYAGLTYGRESLNETLNDGEKTRGFLA